MVGLEYDCLTCWCDHYGFVFRSFWVPGEWILAFWRGFCYPRANFVLGI